MREPCPRGKGIVVGSGVVEPGQLLDLCQKIIGHGSRLGLNCTRLDRSRNGRSRSRYLRLVDSHDRPWIIRVSNHRSPRRSGYPVPHFDLVTLDGTSGLKQICEYLDRIAADKVQWTDPENSVRRPARKRRKKIRTRGR